MNLGQPCLGVNVKFPILLIADDGWVEHVKTAAEIANWTRLAVMKYESRRMVVLDADDDAWKVTRISTDPPLNALGRLLAHTIHNPKVPVRIELEPITLTPIDATRAALVQAIQADNDVLTQRSSAKELRNAVQHARSFREIVAALKRAGAIT
jgi:hypothetical protein